MPINIPTDAIARIPLVFKDQVGVLLAPPTAGASVTSSDPTIFTAVLSSDGSAVEVTPVGVGTATLAYGDGVLSANDTVTVVVPQPTSVSFDDSSATFSPLPVAQPTQTSPTAPTT